MDFDNINQAKVFWYNMCVEMRDEAFDQMLAHLNDPDPYHYRVWNEGWLQWCEEVKKIESQMATAQC